ncbi:MAG: hypothetical protein IKE65_00120, partial [Clostridia bacterium]|nr:hypothetical protein [Clostridia bacterium]
IKGRYKAVEPLTAAFFEHPIHSYSLFAPQTRQIQRLLYLLGFYPLFLVRRAKRAKPPQLVRCSI